MRIKDKKKAVLSFLKVRFLGRRVPVAVRWQLTQRCVLKCQYCRLWCTPKKELETSQIVKILDALKACGTQTISFSGGEPMLRQDIGEILEETSKRGISTEMNSTGALIPQQLSNLRFLDLLKLSLDGPEVVQEMVRGKGSYRIALEAAQAAHAGKIKFIFTTTLTKYNIDQVEFLVETAMRYDTLVAFQPIKGLYRGIEDVGSLLPEPQAFRRAVDKIIFLKKRRSAHIRNSLVGLEHIRSWPDYSPLRCWAGRIFCIIDTDGTLLPCDRISYDQELPNCLEEGFRKAYRRLPDAVCSGCGFCGPVELNALLSFKWGVIPSIKKIL